MDITRRDIVKTAAIIGGGSLMLAANSNAADRSVAGGGERQSERKQHCRSERRSRNSIGVGFFALPADMDQAAKAAQSEARKVENAGPLTVCTNTTWTEPFVVYELSSGQVVGKIDSGMRLRWCDDGTWDLVYTGYLSIWCIASWRWRFTFYNQTNYPLCYLHVPPIDLYNGPLNVHQSGQDLDIAPAYTQIRSVSRAGHGDYCWGDAPE